MDELKSVIWGAILIALCPMVYYTTAVYAGSGTVFENIARVLIILPVLVTFLITYRLAEDFKISLLYGFLLGLVYILTDTIMRKFYLLDLSFMQIKTVILFLVIFSIMGGIGSRFGIIKKALDEIKEE